jgi:hypothetical protein
MASKLIELDEGILVEVEIAEGQAHRISSGFADKVNASLEKVQPLLIAVSRTVGEAWKTITPDVAIQKATVELGLSFEGEGNIFITKAKTGANLTVTLELTPALPVVSTILTSGG